MGARRILICMSAVAAWAARTPLALAAQEPATVPTALTPADMPDPAPAPAAALPPTAPSTTAPDTADIVAESAATTSRKVIVLPVEFTVYQLSASGTETIPEWTVAARKNLNDGLALVMANHAHLDYVAMPQLTAAERQTLDEYIAVAKVVTAQGQMLHARAWAPRRAEFDRHLGPDLAFLRERTGADFAVLVHGSQVEQSGGLIATQLLAAAVGVVMLAGGGTHVSTTVLDLANGDVKWFNSTDGAEILGVGSIDTRKAESTAKVLEKLFEAYPAIPALEPAK